MIFPLAMTKVQASSLTFVNFTAWYQDRTGLCKLWLAWKIVATVSLQVSSFQDILAGSRLTNHNWNLWPLTFILGIFTLTWMPSNSVSDAALMKTLSSPASSLELQKGCTRGLTHLVSLLKQPINISFSPPSRVCHRLFYSSCIHLYYLVSSFGIETTSWQAVVYIHSWAPNLMTLLSSVGILMSIPPLVEHIPHLHKVCHKVCLVYNDPEYAVIPVMIDAVLDMKGLLVYCSRVWSGRQMTMKTVKYSGPECHSCSYTYLAIVSALLGYNGIFEVIHIEVIHI